MLSLENLKPKSSISLPPDPDPLVEKKQNVFIYSASSDRMHLKQLFLH